MRLWPQTLICCTDVPATSAWFVATLALTSGHGGDAYDQLLDEQGELVLQLHDLDVEDHHGAMGDPHVPLGNGVALWFEVDDLDTVERRVASVGATVEKPRHHNPNARQDELWLTAPDGYRVVVAGPSAYRTR